MSLSNLRAIVGLVFIVPACVLCVSGVLGVDPPADLVHPMIVLGGLAAALVLNLSTVLRIRRGRAVTSSPSGIIIRIEGRPLNLAVIAVGFLLAGMIALYLFVENFVPR